MNLAKIDLSLRRNILSDTIIEENHLSHLSGAGGAPAHRRRDLFRLSLRCYTLVWSLQVLFSLFFWSLALSFNLFFFSLPEVLPSSSIFSVAPPMADLQRAPSRFEFFSVKSRRSSITFITTYLCHYRVVHRDFVELESSIYIYTKYEVASGRTHLVVPIPVFTSPILTTHGSQPPARSTSILIINPPPLISCTKRLFVKAKWQLGFALMDLLCLGPSCTPFWPISRIGSPASLPLRPRSDFTMFLKSLKLITRYKSRSGRGRRPSLFFESPSVQGLSNHLSTFGPRIKLHKVFREFYLSDPEPLSLVSTPKIYSDSASAHLNQLDQKGHVSSFSLIKERALLSISSQWERSLPLSSIIMERTNPPISLSLRGELFSVSKPKKFSFPLTVLSSCVAVCTGPEDATSLISMRFGGRGSFSTSQSKVTMWLASGFVVKVMLGLVDEFGLKTTSSTGVLVLVGLHISPDELSSFLKLVSLSLSFACFNYLALMFAFGFCPIKPILVVTT